MTDEQQDTPDRDSNEENNVGNKLDSLLPVPDSAEHEHDDVDGPIDELLPTPGEPDASDDDASTREELEVDTTADDVDDFIPVRNDSPEPAETDAPEPNPTDIDEDDNGTTQAESGSCLVCGETIGESRYCPACGTEQIPASKFVASLAPLFMWSRALSIRMTVSFGVLLSLLALLADSGTMALIFSASIVPIVLLIKLAEDLGGQQKSGWIQVCMMLLIGVAVGLPIAWLSTRMVVRSWFEGGVINFGASVFGGIAVETAGNAPVLVWLTSGFLLPLVMILIIGAAPGGLRMALGMEPRERIGMMLSASVAAGYMIGSGAVFYWPLFTEIAPIMSTSEWTLTLIGIAAVRPLVWILSGAMIGAVVWRYLRNASLPGLAIPAAIATGIPLGYTIFSLAIAPAGLWASTLVGIAFAIATIYVQRKFLDTAEKNDSAFATLPN